MRIAVVGAGAIGSAVAAILAAAGRDVVLVARGQRLRALRAAPQIIYSSGKAIEVPLRVAAADDGLPQVDLSICCVKMPDLEQALPAGRAGVILTLQNGVEAHETAARQVPDAHIAAGRVHGFFEMDGDAVRPVNDHGCGLRRSRVKRSGGLSQIALQASSWINTRRAGSWHPSTFI